MNMCKRGAKILLAVLLATGILVGCGGGSDAAASEAAGLFENSAVMQEGETHAVSAAVDIYDPNGTLLHSLAARAQTGSDAVAVYQVAVRGAVNPLGLVAVNLQTMDVYVSDSAGLSGAAFSATQQENGRYSRTTESVRVTITEELPDGLLDLSLDFAFSMGERGAAVLRDTTWADWKSETERDTKWAESYSRYMLSFLSDLRVSLPGAYSSPAALAEELEAMTPGADDALVFDSVCGLLGLDTEMYYDYLLRAFALAEG